MWSPKHKKRLAWGLGIMIVCASLVAMLLITLQDNVQLYFTPHAIEQGKAPMNRPIRIGGMVVPESLQHGDHLDVKFALTDGQSVVHVNYTGILPDLFKEGQGIVVLGTLNQWGHLDAVQVLAKHDENYMPKGVNNGP